MTQADPNNLRIAFAGSPQFADIVLNNLIAAGILPVVVYTQPDRPQGRGRRVRPNPVKLSATAAQFPVEQPVTLRNADASSRLASYLPDILVVVAYGLILPAPILDVPRFGCLNVHASSLPRWRGAAPIERAYMAGDEKTGTCIMQMEEDTNARIANSVRPEIYDPQQNQRIDELRALDDRFALKVFIDLPTKSMYESMLGTYAERFGLVFNERLVNEFNKWRMRHNHDLIGGRTVRDFIYYYAGIQSSLKMED